MIGSPRRRALASGVSFLILAMGSAVRAQTASQPQQPAPAETEVTGAPATTQVASNATLAAAPSHADGQGYVSDIIVTAQKRSTSLQKTASTISVVAGGTLKELDLRSLAQLNTVVPGYNFEKSPGGNQVITVRGVGTTSSAQSLEQSVAAYINGVYMGGNLREFGTPLYDIAQVEVLKGTQSGISGQNTSVGAMNIVTTAPGSTFGGYLLAGHEFKFDGWNAEGAVDLPITSDLAVRLSGLYDKVGGYVNDVTTHTKTGGSTNYSGRLNAIWRPTDTVDAKLYGQYDKGDSLSGLLVPFGPPGVILSTFIPGLTAKGSDAAEYGSRGEQGGNDYYHYNNLRGSLTVDVDLGGPTLTSITAASRIHDRFGVDGDVSPLDLTWLSQVSRYSQFHQEVRLVSPSGDRLTYIVGAWYRHSKQQKTIDFFLDPPVPPFVPAPHFLAAIPFEQTTDTKSVFGDLHYKITPQLVIGGTARYTNETKIGQIAVLSNWPATFLPYPQTRGRLHPSFVDGSATVQYSPSATTMFYALYAHGTKTGAFIDLTDSLLALRPEKTNSYEIGTKLSVPGARLTFNLSAFRMNVTDYQDVYAIHINGGTSFAAENRNLHTEGVELQSSWRPISGLSLGVAGTVLGSHDQTGGRAARAPTISMSANARYETAIGGDWKAAIFGNAYHTSSYLSGVERPDPENTRTPAYSLFDLGVTAFQDKGFNIKFVVQNLTNKHAYAIVDNNPIDSTAIQGVLLPLRRMVLSIGYNF